MTVRLCLENVQIRERRTLWQVSLYYGREKEMAYKQEMWDEAKKRCRLGDEEFLLMNNKIGSRYVTINELGIRHTSCPLVPC